MRRRTVLSIISAVAGSTLPMVVSAGVRTDVGLDALLAKDPTLTGSGVSVGQVESPDAGSDNFQVAPSAGAINQPAAKFTFHPAAGTVSTHADTIASNWYGTTSGISPGVAHIDVYSVDAFTTALNANTSLAAKVVNQSFGYSGTDPAVDQTYDWYANRRKVLFVNAVGKGLGGSDPNTIDSPASSYNGISVGPSDATTVGPTADGRSKPDVIAPGPDFGGPEASYTAAVVSGVASVLVQAGLRGDGGTGTATTATDNRTLKALILNGAVKPAGWTHTATSPLDKRYGSGVVNVNNSYIQLQGGQHAAITSTVATAGGIHAPPTGVAGNETSLTGWDNATVTGTPTSDSIRHYFFNLPSGSGASSYTLTSSLVWEKLDGLSGINNFDLYLFQDGGTTPIDSSVSTIDNVEQLRTAGLAPGRYDLEVVLRGTGQVSATDTYALAYNFVAVPEPTSLGLLVLGAGTLLRRRPRRLPR